MDAMRMFSQTTWLHQLVLQRRGCHVHLASIIRGLFSSGGLLLHMARVVSLCFQPLVSLERFQAGLIDLLSLDVTPSLRRLTSSGRRRNRHCRSGRHIDRPCHRLQAALANRVDWSTRRTSRSRRHDATRRACACPTRCKDGDGHGGMVMVAGKRRLCGGGFGGGGGCGWGWGAGWGWSWGWGWGLGTVMRVPGGGFGEREVAVRLRDEDELGFGFGVVVFGAGGGGARFGAEVAGWWSWLGWWWWWCWWRCFFC